MCYIILFRENERYGDRDGGGEGEKVFYRLRFIFWKILFCVKENISVKFLFEKMYNVFSSYNVN